MTRTTRILRRNERASVAALPTLAFASAAGCIRLRCERARAGCGALLCGGAQCCVALSARSAGERQNASADQRVPLGIGKRTQRALSAIGYASRIPRGSDCQL